MESFGALIMTDKIAGNMITISSKNSFTLDVTKQSKDNQNKYEKSESIKFANLPTKIDSMSNEKAKTTLETTLGTREILCEVKSRENDGSLLCDVFYLK